MSRKDIPVIFLAGGFGTRLNSVLKGKPKALADINGEPFINILIKKWVDNGFRNFIFSLHYKAEQIIKNLDKFKLKVSVDRLKFQYVIDEEPLGTGGAVLNTINTIKLKNNVFILNADTWLDFESTSLDGLKKNTILVTKVKDVSRYGEIKTNKKNQVLRFNEKTNKKKDGLINAGIYYFDSKKINFKKKVFSIENDYFPVLLKKNLLFVKRVNAEFTDIGVPKDYFNFCKNFK